jgi:hypothetical protein
MAMFKKVLINFLVLVVLIICMFPNRCSGEGFLRVKIVEKERLYQLLRFMSGEGHKIVVYRNNVQGLPKGQVMKDFCATPNFLQLSYLK